MFLLVISSLLYGSSLGVVLAKFITDRKLLSLLDTRIPGVAGNILWVKNYDIFEFIFSVFFSFAIFFFNYLITQKNFRSNINEKNKWSLIFFTFSSLIIFVQSHFITHSGVFLTAIYALIQILFIFSVKGFRKKIEYRFDKNILLNSFFLGFNLMLIVNAFTTGSAISLIFLLLPVFVYPFLGTRFSKFVESPAHLIFLFCVIKPTSATFLLLLLFVTVLLNLTFQIFIKNPVFLNKNWWTYVLFFGFMFLITYNPYFFIGNFDPVEEGFWFGWLQSMINNKHLYKDVAIYHPPLLIWSLYIFTSATDFTIKNVRLFFHLLQITSYFIFFLFAKELSKKKLNIAVATIIMISLSQTLIKNNIDVRLAPGLLSLWFWGLYLRTQNNKYLFSTGFASAIAVFTSTEVGVASLASVIAAIILTQENKLRKISKYVIGLSIGVIPVTAYLAWTGSLSSFISQIYFYISSFSRGYFNYPLERAIEVSSLRYHLIWQNFSKQAWVAESSRMVILAVPMLILTTLYPINLKKFLSFRFPTLSATDALALSSSFFGLVLFRSVLGRSDYYHILFVTLVSIPLTMYIIERFIESKTISLTIITFMLFVMFSLQINENYLSQFFFKYTNYGKIIDEYKAYSSERSGILVGTEVEVEDIDGVVKYLDENTTTDQSIFVFPWNPEIYFLADRKNATSFDTPYAFWSDAYQDKMIYEIALNKPKYVVYNKEQNFGGLTPDALKKVKDYIGENFVVEVEYYPYQILKQKTNKLLRSW